MIRYALSCKNGHQFESWFPSAAAFETLQRSGMVSCPECGAHEITKSLMAPQVVASHEDERPLSTPRDEREKALAELRRRVEENSEYVGMSFATEARAMHEGDTPHRSIWGEARPDEARALIEDGVPVAPLPFLPHRKTQ